MAEVLIVIGIIGIIAEFTIPTLIHNINEQSYKVAYKSAYSTLSQAWTMAATNGDITPCANWGDWSGGTCNQDNFNALKKYFKISKDCGTDTASCWEMSGEKGWSGAYPTSNSTAFIDASGITWTKGQTNPSCEVMIDINGNKKPNKFGKDRFILYPQYYSFSMTSMDPGMNYVANTPKVYYPPDFPNTTTPTSEQQYRCPSMVTDPNYHCYYTSWITGAQ